ncbi:hypothetical protein IW262DRAFT_1295515 [Armillaria fumosa]|nr:hypothetical protein IW262DRAFT_1295515 [Armillaria fumosa]
MSFTPGVHELNRPQVTEFRITCNVEWYFLRKSESDGTIYNDLKEFTKVKLLEMQMHYLVNTRPVAANSRSSHEPPYLTRSPTMSRTENTPRLLTIYVDISGHQKAALFSMAHAHPAVRPALNTFSSTSLDVWTTMHPQDAGHANPGVMICLFASVPPCGDRLRPENLHTKIPTTVTKDHVTATNQKSRSGTRGIGSRLLNDDHHSRRVETLPAVWWIT